MLTGNQLLAPYALASEDKLVIAVSGGVDSMVLLTLLATSHQSLIVAHFDHNLRPESHREARLVRRYAAALRLPFVQGVWAKDQQPASGIEAAAREARYQFLMQVAAAHEARFLVVAHHADDQLETILLQLARSGNVMKMAGLPAARARGALTVLRPLLAVDKAAIYAYADAHQVPYAEDGSNLDLTIRRNRIRHRVVPELRRINPAILAHTQRFSEGLAGLVALAEPRLAELVAAGQRDGCFDWQSCRSQPEAVQRLVLERVLHNWQVQVAPESVTQVLTALSDGEGTKDFSIPGHRLRVSYQQLVLDPEPAATFTPMTLDCDDTWRQLDERHQVGLFHQAPADAATWAYLPVPEVTLRTRKPGDVVHFPDGRKRKLRRLLIDHKIPVAARERLLVAATADACVWVAGAAWVELFQRRQTDIIQSVLAFRTTVDDSEDNNGK